MYETYLSVNKKFKSSINLQYDLYNEEKILEYIPTTDLCDVIKKYVLSVLENTNKATLLAGPYGKGKSYLMLVVTYIFSKNKTANVWNKFVKKVENIDLDLAGLLKQVYDKQIYLMPVIVNNNSFDELEQNFLLAIKNALTDNKIYDVIPETSYKLCEDIITKWKSDKSLENLISKCEKTLNFKIDELLEHLSKLEIEAYEKFKSLFSCVTHGVQFNPLVSDDISIVYDDVTKKIKAHGYSGTFVIFDEFGAFLENKTQDFSVRLNKIQQFAERCKDSSSDSQMHLCCITHKELSLYNKNKELKNSFETISGRFKQFRFDRSMDENYQIICSAIEKKSKYKDLVKIARTEYSELIETITNSNIFSSSKQVDYIFNNGFPFNPVSLYILIQVSEKIAQNERTLFTFLSDTDVNSFTYFINNNEGGLLNAPMIYDYFENLIKDNQEYKNIYYSVESAKKTSVKNEEHDIFKTIGLMKIINDDIKLNSTIENIAICLGKNNSSELENIINSLVSSGILKKNINDNSIDFTFNSSKEMQTLIDDVVNSKNLKKSDDGLLNDFDNSNYYISHAYNFNYKMTRFFKSIYVNTTNFVKLKSLSILFQGIIADGIVINLLNDIKVDISEIKNKLQCNQGNIIVRYNENNISTEVIRKIKLIFAAKDILESNLNISEELKNALPLLIDDYSQDVKIYLNKYCEKSKCICNAMNDVETFNISECIEKSLCSYYSKTFVLNNDQINKNVISSPTTKSRNTIIDTILKNEPLDTFGVTSAEATIANSFLFAESDIHNGDIIKVIENWFVQNSGIKVSSESLISLLKQAPYGMRDGIIPLLIARAISRVCVNNNDKVDAMILYNNSTELAINALNLSKILINPSNYYFFYTSLNAQKLKIVTELLKYFDCQTNNSFNENIQCLLTKIKFKISNLPPIIIKTSNNDNLLGLNKELIEFKDIMLKRDLNPYEIIFEKLPNVFKVDFNKLPDAIQKAFNKYDNVMEQLYKDTIADTKKIFKKEYETIKATFEMWKADYNYIDDIVFENIENNIFKSFSSIQYNDKVAVDKISFACLGCSIEDWNIKKKDTYYSSIESFIEKVETYDKDNSISKNDFQSSSDVQLSDLGQTLYSNLIDSIEEYGSSLKNEEKVAILNKLLNEILGR